MKRWHVEVHTENRVVQDHGTFQRYDMKPMRVEKMVVEAITEFSESRMKIKAWKVDGKRIAADQDDDRVLSMPIPAINVSEAAKRGAMLKHPGTRIALVKGSGVENYPEEKTQKYTIRAVFDGGDGEVEESVVTNATTELEAKTAVSKDVQDRYGVAPHVTSIQKIEDLDGKKRETLQHRASA